MSIQSYFFSMLQLTQPFTDVLTKGITVSCRWWSGFDLYRRLFFTGVVLFFNYVQPEGTQVSKTTPHNVRYRKPTAKTSRQYFRSLSSSLVWWCTQSLSSLSRTRTQWLTWWRPLFSQTYLFSLHSFSTPAIKKRQPYIHYHNYYC